MADPKIIDPLDFLGSAKPADDATKKLLDDMRRIIEANGISHATLISPHRQVSPSRRISMVSTPVAEGPFDALQVKVLKSRDVKGAEIKEEWWDELSGSDPRQFQREFMGEWIEGEVDVQRPDALTIPIKIDFTLEGQKGSKTWNEAKGRLERRGPPAAAPWLPHTDEEIAREVECMERTRSVLGHSRYVGMFRPRAFSLSDL